MQIFLIAKQVDVDFYDMRIAEYIQILLAITTFNLLQIIRKHFFKLEKETNDFFLINLGSFSESSSLM